MQLHYYMLGIPYLAALDSITAMPNASFQIAFTNFNKIIVFHNYLNRALNSRYPAIT